MKYDIPAALQALKPGAEWVLRGDTWSGLEWLDLDGTKIRDSGALKIAMALRGCSLLKCFQLSNTSVTEKQKIQNKESYGSSEFHIS